MTAEEFLLNRSLLFTDIKIDFDARGNVSGSKTLPVTDEVVRAMNDFALAVKDKEPVLRGCSGPCACSGRCKDIVGWIDI